jgi:hypothetical protein
MKIKKRLSQKETNEIIELIQKNEIQEIKIEIYLDSIFFSFNTEDIENTKEKILFLLTLVEKNYDLNIYYQEEENSLGLEFIHCPYYEIFFEIIFKE